MLNGWVVSVCGYPGQGESHVLGRMELGRLPRAFLEVLIHGCNFNSRGYSYYLIFSACRSPARGCETSGKGAVSAPDVRRGVGVYGISQTVWNLILHCLLIVWSWENS